jgi:hypothetical protein
MRGQGCSGNLLLLRERKNSKTVNPTVTTKPIAAMAPKIMVVCSAANTHAASGGNFGVIFRVLMRCEDAILDEYKNAVCQCVGAYHDNNCISKTLHAPNEN